MNELEEKIKNECEQLGLDYNSLYNSLKIVNVQFKTYGYRQEEIVLEIEQLVRYRQKITYKKNNVGGGG